MADYKSRKWFSIIFGLFLLLGNMGALKMHSNLGWFQVSMVTFGMAYGAIIIDRHTGRKL